MSVPLAVLGIAKSLDSALVGGSQATWVLTVTNHGPSPTSGEITVSDALPAGLTYASASTDAFSCASAGQEVTCTSTVIMAVGETHEIEITTDVVATPGTTITNTAAVGGGNEIDGDPLPPAVIENVIDQLSNPSHPLIDSLGLPGVVSPTAEASEEALAFTGRSAMLLARAALFLIAAGGVIEATTRRLKLATVRPPGRTPAGGRSARQG